MRLRKLARMLRMLLFGSLVFKPAMLTALLGLLGMLNDDA
jgi:hypothetical protein